jgi:hypothetical protein
MNAGMKSGLIGGALIVSVCFAAFSIYKSNDQGSQRSEDQNSGYCGKTAKGYTVCIQKSDVTCSEETVEPYSWNNYKGYFATVCSANGTITDLSGKTEHWTAGRGNCKKIFPERTDYHDTTFSCRAARHYGLFQ